LRCRVNVVQLIDRQIRGCKHVWRLIEPHFSLVQLRTTHFNPIIIWQDFRDQGRDVSNVERAGLLKRTTRYKQSAAMKPVQALYRATERILGALKLADNLVAVLQKR
jgi:hypothetical protein